MIFKEELFTQGRLSKDEIEHVVSYLENNPTQLNEFYTLLESKDDRVLFQSSWILLNACKKSSLKPSFLPFLVQIYPLVISTKNTSFLRNGLRYYIEVGIPEEIQDGLINFSFDILENKYQEVAILNNAFSIIELNIPQRPELIQPLYEAVFIIKDRQPISFHSKFNKFTKRYSEQIRIIA